MNALIGSRLVDLVLTTKLYAVRLDGAVHFVVAPDFTKGRTGLFGPTLCGKMPPKKSPRSTPKHVRVSSPGTKTCNACGARASRSPTRVEWR